MYKSSLIVGLLILGLCGSKCAADEPKVLAVGEWSKPVKDDRGYAIRGRLVLCEKPSGDKLCETPLYIELQDASEFIGGDLRLYCAMGRHDFRAEAKEGLACELKDEAGRVVESQSFPFGGGVPKSQWISLPSDSTIRLRATPFGIRRESAITLCPHLGSQWVIGQDDAKAYFLSGTFTIAPPKDAEESTTEHVWRGTIDLPAMKIVNR